MTNELDMWKSQAMEVNSEVGCLKVESLEEGDELKVESLKEASERRLTN